MDFEQLLGNMEYPHNECLINAETLMLIPFECSSDADFELGRIELKLLKNASMKILDRLPIDNLPFIWPKESWPSSHHLQISTKKICFCFYGDPKCSKINQQSVNAAENQRKMLFIHKMQQKSH
ncbi:hypothetical protein HUJ04_000791 [Dendroctonus ponderosae]|nr:hypothetical protein HUJ04_000791 [Dendroctonus ponderosae]